MPEDAHPPFPLNAHAVGQQDSAGCDLCDSGIQTTAEAIVRVSGHLTAFYGLSAADAVGETDSQSVALALETIVVTRAFVARAFLGSNRGSVWVQIAYVSPPLIAPAQPAWNSWTNAHAPRRGKL